MTLEKAEMELNPSRRDIESFPPYGPTHKLHQCPRVIFKAQEGTLSGGGQRILMWRQKQGSEDLSAPAIGDNMSHTHPCFLYSVYHFRDEMSEGLKTELSERD